MIRYNMLKCWLYSIINLCAIQLAEFDFMIIPSEMSISCCGDIIYSRAIALIKLINLNDDGTKIIL